MNNKINNKKVLSSILVASSVLSSSYLFYLTDGLSGNTNVVYANEYNIIYKIIYNKLEEKGIRISEENKNNQYKLIEYLKRIGLEITEFITVDDIVINPDGTVYIGTIKAFGEKMTKDYFKNVYKKYKHLWKRSTTDSDVINKNISDIYSFLVKDDKINLENLRALNKLCDYVTVENNIYKMNYTGSISDIDAVEPVKNFIKNTCLKDYSIKMVEDKIVLTYKGETETTIDTTQKLLKHIIELKNVIEEKINAETNNPGTDNPDTDNPDTDNSEWVGGSSGNSSDGSFVVYDGSTESVESDDSFTQNTGNSLNIQTQNNLSGDSELMANGESISAVLYEKITANNVNSFSISNKFKGLVKTLIDKLEVLLKVPANSSNSLVVDVTNVYSDVNMNDIVLNLDKSYIGKEIYISCIYDDQNIFILTEGNQWVQYTNESTEVKGVTMDKSSSFKFTGISRPCAFVITVKN